MISLNWIATFLTSLTQWNMLHEWMLHWSYLSLATISERYGYLTDAANCYKMHRKIAHLRCLSMVFTMLKLLSHSWWILIPQNKTNQYKQQYSSQIIIINITLLWISLKSLVVGKICETNTRVLWTWKDFHVYKYSGNSFAAHFAIVKITPHVYWPFLFQNNVFKIKRCNGFKFQ